MPKKLDYKHLQYDDLPKLKEKIQSFYVSDRDTFGQHKKTCGGCVNCISLRRLESSIDDAIKNGHPGQSFELR